MLRRASKWLRGLGRDLHEHDAVRAASAMAFHAFFSLIPLVALTGWTAHQLTNAGDILGPVIQLAPASVSSLADSEFMRLSESGSAVLPPLSAIGFLWLSTDGVTTAMRVFERMFDAPQRGWWLRRLVALGFVLAAIIVLTLSGAVALLAAYGGGTVANVAGVVAPVLALWFLVAAFFRVATIRGAGKPRHGFRGALVTLLLWLCVSLLFSLYVTEIGTYSRFYGSLATVVVALLWLWLIAFSVLVGGEVNARIEGVRRAMPASGPPR